MRPFHWVFSLVLAGMVVVPAAATPIRTTNPGTGIFIGRVVTPRFLLTEASGNGVEFEEVLMPVEITTSPSPRTVAGVVIPYLERELRTRGGTFRQEGLGDVSFFGKYRFHRKLAVWGDAQAAFRLAVRTPTGETTRPRAGLGLSETLSRSLQTGTGTWGVTGDVSYLTARRRFVWGGNIAYTANLEAHGFRPGNELRLNLDTEYLLLPVKYQEPGKEVFVLLEWLLVHREPSRLMGRDLPNTGGTQFFLAPGLQYVPTDRLLFEASVALPVYQNLRGNPPKTDFNLLVGLRYVY
jgi:hypothetical protein